MWFDGSTRRTETSFWNFGLNKSSVSLPRVLETRWGESFSLVELVSLVRNSHGKIVSAVTEVISQSTMCVNFGAIWRFHSRLSVECCCFFDVTSSNSIKDSSEWQSTPAWVVEAKEALSIGRSSLDGPFLDLRDRQLQLLQVLIHILVFLVWRFSRNIGSAIARSVEIATQWLLKLHGLWNRQKRGN